MSMSPTSHTLPPETPARQPWYVGIFYLILSIFPSVTIRREGGQPYLTRWCLLGGSPYDSTHPFLPFNLFLHCFHASDGDTPHNHPWTWARSLILKGSYREYRVLDVAGALAFGRTPSIFAHTYRPGGWNRIDEEMFHHVELETPKVWTLFLCGRKTKQWGFLAGDRTQGYRFEVAREFLSRLPGATSNDRMIDE